MGPPLAAQSEGAQAGVGKNWPAATLAEVEAILCAPGQPFEMETVKIRGVPTRVWKNALPNLGALARAARAHGDRLFTIYEDERVSYDAWFRATAALAAEFQRLGISRGDRIALAMRNLPEWPVVFFAATSIGAIITPLNAWWTAGELSYGLSVSGTRLLVCDAERWERLEPEIAALPVLRDIFVSRAENALGAKARVLESVIGRPPDYGDLPEADLPAVAVAPDEDATIFFTSGTSGKPKGAVGAHRNILTNILTSAYGAARSALRRGEAPQPMAHKTGLLVIPLFHVTACNARMVGAMLAGHTLIFMRKWDTIKAFEIIEREKVNSTGGVPTIAWQLLEHPDRGKYDLSSLEAIAYGGAPSAPELVRKIKSEFGALPGNGWGMTETSATVTMIAAEDYLARPDSCGPAAPVGDLKITDDAGVELPVG
ncbi:MAG TPA: class I adenylate-forming enzyme family protein, partial [Parvularculaceae bacterium]|nr:class I adenylate-forming enzyme family protein [Parvularculaceae bacterium]